MAVSPIDQTLKINKRITKRFRRIFRKYFWAKNLDLPDTPRGMLDCLQKHLTKESKCVLELSAKTARSTPGLAAVSTSMMRSKACHKNKSANVKAK